MRWIYHLTTPSAWRIADAAYRAPSLDTEGFIHCSNQDQVARVANLFYAAEPELLVLCIDANLLTSPLRDEDAGGGETFPHVHGAINREAIREVRRLNRTADGTWVY